jgi:hypothetical protein
VTIGFLSDLVQFFNENQSGWALWNFSGSFGILNSDRSDCTYEYFQGYQLDRQMLDILTRNDNTGVTVPDSPQALVTFPSPAKDYLSIATHGFSGVVCVDIFDVSGRLMKSFRTVPDGSETLQLDVSDIRSGMYLVALVNKGFRYTGKIIIHE